jgi:hypothetical protein
LEAFNQESFARDRYGDRNAARSPFARSNGTEYRPNRFSKRAELHYGMVWGVDSLTVKWAESGEMIRFSFRVLDANKAAMLNDKKLEPTLIDPQARVSLVNGKCLGERPAAWRSSGCCSKEGFGHVKRPRPKKGEI